MRKIYSLVLMAMMLLVGTNVWADPIEVTSTNQAISGLELQQAINNVASSAELKLMKDVVVTPGKPIWIGTYEANGTPKDITLDLNGHNITCAPASNGQYVYMFVLSHGQLKVVNKGAAASISLLENAGNKANGNSAIFMVFGSKEPTNVIAKEAAAGNLYTYLSVAENITLTATRGAGIQLDVARTEGQRAWNQIFSMSKNDKYLYYGTEDYAPLHDLNLPGTDVTYGYFTTINPAGNPASGYAYGVRIDVKCNMNFADPVSTATSHNGEKTYCVKSNGIIQKPASGAENNVAYIHIFPQAVLTGDPYTPKAAAVYAGGFADWFIEGTCTGASGVYMKSGEVTLENATITSTWTGTANVDNSGNSGVNSTGNAVTIESSQAYAGEIVLNVTGNTEISTNADDGAAVMDFIATDNNNETKVDKVSITGGTLSGEYAIVVTQQTAANDKVEAENGVTFVGEAVVGNSESTQAAIAEIIPNDVHTSTVQDPTDPDKTITIISAGSTEQVATFNGQLNSKGLLTFSAPDSYVLSGVTAWKATGFSNGVLTFSEVTGTIPAGTGVILYGTANQEFTFSRDNGDVTGLTQNILKPSTAWSANLENVYILHGDELWLYTGTTFPANKAFVQLTPQQLSGNQAPQRIRMVFNQQENATAVESVEAESVKAVKFMGADGQLYIRRGDVVYTVQGQVVK